jgi:hypothetical protein
VATDVGSSGADAGPGETGVFDDRTTSEVLTSLLANGQALLRTEVELAKLELTGIVRDKAIALASLLLAGLFGLFILAFVGVTIAVALQNVLAPWLAWLLVTVGYTLVAGTAVAIGIRLLKRPVVPERAKAELDRTVSWAKDQAKQQVSA